MVKESLNLKCIDLKSFRDSWNQLKVHSIIMFWYENIDI